MVRRNRLRPPKSAIIASGPSNAVVPWSCRTCYLVFAVAQFWEGPLKLVVRHLGDVTSLFAPFQPRFYCALKSGLGLGSIFSCDCVERPKPVVWFIFEFAEDERESLLAHTH